jgi:hypothetical protein
MNEDEDQRRWWIVGRGFPSWRDSMPLKMDRQNSILESITNALQFYASRQVEPLLSNALP